MTEAVRLQLLALLYILRKEDAKPGGDAYTILDEIEAFVRAQ